MDRLLGTSWLVIASVAIATVAMYLLLILLVRVLGQRSLTGLSSFDLGCVVALGAVMGRTMLLATPTLVSGLVALTTLFLLQALLRRPAVRAALGRVFSREPVLLMRGATMLMDNMRRAQVTEADLRQTLRLTGISRLEQVRFAILERNGAISVLRGDVEVDPVLIADLPISA